MSSPGAAGDLVHTMEDHEDEVTSVAMSDDGLTVASASKDRTVKVWNGHRGRVCVQGSCRPASLLGPLGRNHKGRRRGVSGPCWVSPNRSRCSKVVQRQIALGNSGTVEGGLSAGVWL